MRRDERQGPRPEVEFPFPRLHLAGESTIQNVGVKTFSEQREKNGRISKPPPATAPPQPDNCLRQSPGVWGSEPRQPTGTEKTLRSGETCQRRCLVPCAENICAEGPDSQPGSQTVSRKWGVGARNLLTACQPGTDRGGWPAALRVSSWGGWLSREGPFQEVCFCCSPCVVVSKYGWTHGPREPCNGPPSADRPLGEPLRRGCPRLLHARQPARTNTPRIRFPSHAFNPQLPRPVGWPRHAPRLLALHLAHLAVGLPAIGPSRTPATARRSDADMC